MSDYPANTAYAQRHAYTRPWQHKETPLSQNQRLDVDDDADADADADAEYELEGQPGPGTSAFEGDKVGEELDFDDVNTGEADDDLGSFNILQSTSPGLIEAPQMDRDELDLSDHLARFNKSQQYRFKPPASLNPGHGQASNTQTSGSGGFQPAYYSGITQESDPRASNVQGLGRQPQTMARGLNFSASPAEESDDFGDEYDPESLNVGAGGSGKGTEEWSERD
ncbi:hypothetical protein BDV10DRAFT_190238 [Aspergillus recurvatus]